MIEKLRKLLVKMGICKKKIHIKDIPTPNLSIFHDMNKQILINRIEND